MTQLIVVSAPSGAGKTTLCNRLLSDFPQLTLSISSTTRAPRGQEQDGREYFFLAKDDFEERIRSDRFAEWALVHGNYYGTSKEVIESAFAEGRSVLFDIDVQGAAILRKTYGKDCFLVFISPPSVEALEARLRKRATDNEETIQRRLKNARAEMARTGEFDLVIINDDLERAYLELKNAVNQRLSGSNGC
ncbi:MAG TPA: guanylate kinase [Bdellovibrionota bacterium]|nr:guanylate kinase [Bdellovibrionota bacterium]